MALILTSMLSGIVTEAAAIALATQIFAAIEEIRVKPRRVQFKLKSKYIEMIAVLERRSERLGWTKASDEVKEGKAAVKEILDELEKLTSWDI